MITALQQRYDHRRILQELDQLIIKDPSFDKSYFELRHQISFKWSSEWDRLQPGTKYWFSGVGSLFDEQSKSFITSTSTFCALYDKLRGSYIEWVLADVEEIAASMGVNIGRVRILRLAPKSCYTLHLDPEEFRFHIPLISNLKCFFVAGDQIDRMTVMGQLYQFRTKLLHTAVNASMEERFHLVFDTH